MFQDPALQLHTVKRAQQDHRDIAARHRLAKRPAAVTPSVTASRRVKPVPAPSRSRLGFRLRLHAG